MTEQSLSPNELVDIYDGLFTVLENLPEDTHPLWQLAIESVLFGGEGLADSAQTYGEQQAERNTFKMSSYREQYGNGEHVTEFPAIDTATPRERDRLLFDEPLELPVGPKSQRVLPLIVDEESLTEAISILAEFPAEPGAETPGQGVDRLLDPHRFPRLSTQSTEQQSTNNNVSESGSESATEPELNPNELADLYDLFRQFLNGLPDETHPVWRTAIENVIFGGEFLRTEATHYGEQQAERNDFSMSDYRDSYGNGDRVTVFPALENVAEESTVDSTPIPVAPESGVKLPLEISDDQLKEALSHLSEFPAEPDAQKPGDGVKQLLVIDSLLGESEIQATDDEQSSESSKSSKISNRRADPGSRGAESGSERSDIGSNNMEKVDKSSNLNQPSSIDENVATANQESGEVNEQVLDWDGSAERPESKIKPEGGEDQSVDHSGDQEQINEMSQSDGEPTNDDQQEPTSRQKNDRKVLRNEGVGETSVASDSANGYSGTEASTDNLEGSRKYDDPRAERAHRKAQQRDPTNIVDIGETITLVLKEVDFTKHPPTVMGTKNQLVIFVSDAPRHVSEYDVIRAKVVDFGGKGNSAEAVFLGYAD